MGNMLAKYIGYMLMYWLINFKKQGNLRLKNERNL